MLFKLYKSYIRLDELKGKPHRVLCELYAKLCAILIFHGMVSCTKLKKNTELSLTKAFIELKRRIRELFLVLTKINSLKAFLKKLAITWSQFSLKDKRRNANSGLGKEERVGNRRLFGLHRVRNESRKDVNQKVDRRSVASMFNF